MNGTSTSVEKKSLIALQRLAMPRLPLVSNEIRERVRHLCHSQDTDPTLYWMQAHMGGCMHCV